MTYIYYYFCILLIFVIFIRFSNTYNPTCLDFRNRISWNRNFHINDRDIPITLDVSRRTSHRILSYIVKILLQERLGYRNVKFNYFNEDKLDVLIKRLSCADGPCANGNPVSHINLEVWFSPGYIVRNMIQIIDCGPLGPTARKGVFVESDKADKIFAKNKQIIDYWKIFYKNDIISHFSGCDSYSKLEFDNITDLVYDTDMGQFASNNNYFLNWYPSVETVQGNFSRVLFPDCWQCNFNNSCDFEVHQLTKLVWSHLRDYADKAFYLINELRFSTEQFLALLKNVNVSALDNTNGSAVDDNEYYRVACDWLRNNTSVWSPWTLDWNVKDKIYLPILVSNYAIWRAKETMNASLYGIKTLNSHIFNDTHYQIVPKIHELVCDEDLILSQYLNLIQAYGSKIMGFIVCLCPRTFKSLIKISDLQQRIILSSSMESTHSMNLTEYKYFFSTQPNMYHYNLFLIKMFRQLNWTRVVILKKDDHLLDEKIFPRYNIKVLASLMTREDQIDYGDIYSYLVLAKKQLKASIFIVDYLVHGTQTVLCAASNLGMTLSKGYVFIVNPLYESTWLNNHTSKHCPLNDSISKEIFVIKHDINAEHIDDYIRINVRKFNVLAQMTQDAVLYLGNSFHELIKSTPSAYFHLQSTPISNKFVHLLENRYQIMLGAKKNYQRKVFNVNHERNGIWKVQKVAYVLKYLVSLPLFKWNINNGFELSTGLPAIETLYSFDIPSDTNNESDCPLEMIRHLLGWSCTATLILINIVCIATVIVILIAALMWYYRRQVVIMEDRYKEPFEDICAELADIDIRSSDVVISLQVGKGAFGIVYGGEAKRNNRWESVAIKLIKKEADYQGKIDFLTEAKLMRNLEHPNIVKLIGICLNPLKPAIYLVMELVVNGDLEDYLLTNRITASKDPCNKMVCPSLLTRFVKNVASGTEYLHHQSLIHRDLACRNFFLSEDYVVKIGDFGLTRNINDAQINQYYRTTRHFVLPARWMPPEAVQFGYFSVQSDIWSLGVVIFEVATFCSRPYFNVTDEEVPEHVKRNSVPLVNYLPESAKDTEVYKLIEKCCQYKREERPQSMSEIVTYLQDNDECIRPYITNNPPQPTSTAIRNLMNMPESHQRPSSMISGGLNRFKSTSRSRTSVANWPLFSDSHNNVDAIIQTESDTGRVAFPCNPDQVPFIPNEAEFITVDHNTNRIGSKKKHKSNKMLYSNLNSSQSRSSDLMDSCTRIEDDREPSYVSCPDSGNITCFGDFNILDFPNNGSGSSSDVAKVKSVVRSASGDDKTTSIKIRNKPKKNTNKTMYNGLSSRPSHYHNSHKMPNHHTKHRSSSSRTKGRVPTTQISKINRRISLDNNLVQTPDLIEPLLLHGSVSTVPRIVDSKDPTNVIITQLSINDCDDHRC